jgi:cyclic pyranopterin phosphate synthase
VAERWRYRDGAGEIGVISSVTQAFCSSCNRMRLSTEGSLYTCLFGQSGHDLKSLLRAARRRGAARRDRRSLAATHGSVLRNQDFANFFPKKVEMSYIGG